MKRTAPDPARITAAGGAHTHLVAAGTAIGERRAASRNASLAYMNFRLNSTSQASTGSGPALDAASRGSWAVPHPENLKKPQFLILQRSASNVRT